VEEFIESSNYRPGQPLRSWTSGEMFAAIDAPLHLKQADAGPALGRLLRDEPLSTADVVALGRLVSVSVMNWYEPMLTLWPDPRIAPDVAEFLRRLPEKVWR
jgi:hypothetical protein